MARIAGINIPQNKLVHVGLTYIYGIGNKFSSQICSSLKIPKEKRVNQLTDDEILKRHKYNWFVRLSHRQVLGGDFQVSKFMILSLGK